jgi:surface carbohydrate biosynthesis protein
MVENPTNQKKIVINIHRAVNFLKRYKRIVWYSEKSCDVLIYDGVGSENLRHCMPAESSVFIINNREEITLFISISFFLWIFLGLIKYRRLNLAITTAIIKHLNPKVIITYIDNAPNICWIKKFFPLIPALAVQNGTRWDFSNKNKAFMEYDYYFGFGSVEADIFLQGGHTVSSFHPIGSLYAGIFRSEYPVSKEKEFDLCYISQLDAIPLNQAELDKWTLEIFTSYYEVGKRHFDIIAQYAEENKLTLCVAMRYPQDSAEFTREREYFSSQGNAKIEYIPQSRFSSYRAVQSSRLTFTISSTLGYEALGWGERVIFAKDVEAVRALVTQGAWTDNLVTHRLPELQRLQSLDYSELSFKATELLKMTNENYINYSKSARAYYMNYDDEQKPHEIIKNKIKELLATGHNNAL